MAVKIQLARKKISLGVGDLVAEPLNGGRRAAGMGIGTRMALGREAHVRRQRDQADLHEGYAREISVQYNTTVDGFAVSIKGRIDGVYPARNDGPCVVEEIKSVIAPPLMFAVLEANSYPHYAEQLRLYCFFVQMQQPRTVGRLVFVNVADGTTREIEVPGPFDDCEKLIAERVRLLIGQAAEQQRQQQQRQSLAAQLKFPHDKPRKYQDQMISAVEKALAAGRHLLVSAPSGIGKTTAALYPVLKHAYANDMRVFFVTAKNTQQEIARDTLSRMGAPTAVMFRARELMCINDVYACREEFCKHLRDFHLKLETTRVAERLLEQRLISPEMMMAAGRQVNLCPFEIALLEAEQTDVIVCDYNYVFDPQVYFRRFFQDEDYSNAILIIDEAHNLVQRALDYYSPSLSRRQVEDLRGDLRHVEPSLARDIVKFLDKLVEFFRRNKRSCGDEYSQLEDNEGTDAEKYLLESPRGFFDELKPAFSKLATRYLLDKITNGRAIPDDPVEKFFAEFGQFCGVLALEGEEFSYIFDTTEGQSLKILCKDSSRQLAQRLDGFHSVIAMSATLVPMEFYRQMLGFDPERTDQASFPSPFPQENRKILVQSGVSTTYRMRAAHYGKIAEIIATTAGAHSGNYMALFPSYEFLRGVAEKIKIGSSRPGEQRWQLHIQEPRMAEKQRQELLEALKLREPPKLVFAVQGGLFAEGVDYPGETLSGVIVVSPALPLVSFERELMRQHYEKLYAKGFEFAYLYPGMNRVIQSVGRLIRSETDCGVAVLVCRRFAQQQYSALFPPDWSESGKGALVSRDLDTELRQFWREIEVAKAG